MSKLNFSVCMSVYHGDNAEFFKEAIDSLYTQTRQPDEVLLVVDGPVNNEINHAISVFASERDSFNVIRLERNCGHAIARQIGLDATKYEYIAIMDSDDIAVPERFEKQITYMEAHPEVDVLGGQITEFIGSPTNVIGTRIVPQKDADIKAYLKRRCPMNFVTVMLKKSSVLNVGGYIDWFCEEDYYLWLRMAKDGYKFANLPDTLVNVRVGKDMYARRGGIKYFKSEAKLQKYMWDSGIITFPFFSFNVLVRLFVQIIIPNWLRGFIFQKLFRK